MLFTNKAREIDRRLRGVIVFVVPIPPRVRWGLGVALGRVLPVLLASEPTARIPGPAAGPLPRHLAAHLQPI